MKRVFRGAYNTQYEEYVCVDAIGDLITPTYVTQHFKVLLQKHGLDDIRFHDLRHTLATHALRYGMDVKTLASTIGHESVETTLNVYSHTTDEGMRAAAQRIDRAMGQSRALRTKITAPKAWESKHPTQDRKSHHARNLSLVRASTDGREQVRSIR